MLRLAHIIKRKVAARLLQPATMSWVALSKFSENEENPKNFKTFKFKGKDAEKKKFKTKTRD